MRQTALMTLLLILVGCGGASKQYLLSVDDSRISQRTKKHIQIGVDKVTVPGYMEESQVATEKSGGEINYRNEIWAVPTSKALTTTLIRSLQRKFSNPNVYLFPWDVEKENGIRVKVTLNRFIYSNGRVILEATYFIKRIGSKHKKSYMFTTQVTSGSNTSAVVQAMGVAFGKLVEEIGRRL
jgi:uncharacterized lipoprotein YmbA